MDDRRAIELARRMLNHRFSWTCETLDLELFDDPQLTYSDSLCKDGQAWMPRLGTGFTKVARDEWNAHLVVTFLQWVSSRLPTVTVKVHDEGDYIRARYLRFERGIPALDLANIARWRDYLKSNGYVDHLVRLDEAERLAQIPCHTFFADVTAEEYLDRPELAELDVSQSELAKMTLNQVSHAITLPWRTTWLIKGKR
jgi:hypothetical protein